jgi:four helix bundle protein
MNMTELGHEKLKVYRQALEHVTWMHQLLAEWDQSAAVIDQWIRAAESVLENIANGNSRRTRSDRNYYFDVALGSGLECAACLDICKCREMISEGQLLEGKKQLQPVVNMIAGLREAQSMHIREERATYGKEYATYFFPHEKLDAYQAALELVTWYHQFAGQAKASATHMKRLDTGTTSLVLNIAEGNGRFNETEQVRFLDIAHTCAMRIASYLDVLGARQEAGNIQIAEGKKRLAKVVPKLLGLRAYAERNKGES